MISANFEAWYPPAGLESRAFYWDQYERHLLEGKGWQPDAVAGLDEDTRKIVERISDPTRTAAFPARGLVVGYVQSGKTANFTGVIAKGIDAGYRLVIVLAGTLDILREQTQRRLDMELVGKENILQGWDENDPDLEPHDYADDADWAEKFVSFGFRPSSRDLPDIIRLTGGGNDYRKLGHGIVALEMQKKNKLKPLYEPDNLFPCGARLAVVKKNSTVLKRLVSDLKKVRKQLGEIPTLIIDDESDQASVNTTDPASGKKARPSGPASTACCQSCSRSCRGHSTSATPQRRTRMSSSTPRTPRTSSPRTSCWRSASLVATWAWRTSTTSTSSTPRGNATRATPTRRRSSAT